MLRRILYPLLALAIIGLPLAAQEDKKEAERLENCGTVLREILDIPEDIPQDLLDKAECVIIYPSVMKDAFVVGGSYGRGAMTCRTGEQHSGPWSAPIPDRGPSDQFRTARHERTRGAFHSSVAK